MKRFMKKNAKPERFEEESPAYNQVMKLEEYNNEFQRKFHIQISSIEEPLKFYIKALNELAISVMRLDYTSDMNKIIYINNDENTKKTIEEYFSRISAFLLVDDINPIKNLMKEFSSQFQAFQCNRFLIFNALTMNFIILKNKMRISVIEGDITDNQMQCLIGRISNCCSKLFQDEHKRQINMNNPNHVEFGKEEDKECHNIGDTTTEDEFNSISNNPNLPCEEVNSCFDFTTNNISEATNLESEYNIMKFDLKNLTMYLKMIIYF
jgi:hypothetical protein